MYYITDLIIEKYSQSFDEIRHNNTVIIALASLFPAIISIGYLFNSDTDIKKIGIIIIVILASIIAIHQLTLLILSNLQLRLFQINFEVVLLDPDISDEKGAKTFTAAKKILKESNSVLSKTIYKSRYLIFIPYLSALFLVLELSSIILRYVGIEFSALGLIIESFTISVIVYLIYINDFFSRIRKLESLITQLTKDIEKKELIITTLKQKDFIHNKIEYWNTVLKENNENMQNIIKEYLYAVEEGINSYEKSLNPNDKDIITYALDEVNSFIRDMTLEQKIRLRRLNNKFNKVKN